MTVHNIHNKKSVSGVILLLVIFQLQFGVAQSRYDFCTNEGILQFKPNGSMTFNQVNLKPKGLIPIFPKGILLRSASGRAQFIGPYLNQAVDSCVFYNVPGNYFSTVLHKKDANNLVIFPVSSSEYAIVFTRRYKFYAPLYQSNGNGLYYDIYNESTGKMKFGGNGKVIATGTFDIYSSASQAAATTVDIFQKSSKNYDYWLLAHNRDSICVFSFSKDSIYMSDVHLKNSTEYFIDAKPQDGLNKLGVLHNRNLVFSATGKYIVYQQVHQVLQLTSKDTVSAELENSVSLLHFDLQRGTIGASQTIDSDHFFDKVQYNPNPDRFSPFLLSQYELIAEGRALFSDNDSFLFYYKARIEKHPENTAPDIERYRVILRFNLKDSKAKPDSIVVDRYFSDMLWAPDRNIYAIRNFNPKAKLVRVDLPTRHDGNKLRIDTNALLESPKFWGNSFSWFFQEKYYPEIKYSSGCNMDTIIVENQSHPYFIHFKWHLKYRGKTIVIDTTASNLRFVPKTGGSYHLIFTAWRTKGQEKTIDTIIDVIKPPKAAIRIDSIISCAHKQINFFDASVSDTTNAKTGAMWNWRFVKDGVLKKTSKNKNPHISFSNEGNYKISLVYSNGFCMDTARYIDPLYILKAPKAGFNLSDTIACATAYISATSLDSGSVSKRFFLLNDKVKSTDSVWQLVIDSSGYYKITQILTGPTGCTTRDSAYVRIRPGFTKNDSTALLYATVLDSERVQLKWLNRSEGAGYILSRSYNDSLFSQVNLSNPVQDTLVDTVPVSTNQMRYSYRIALIDSCGNISTASNPATTILLQAKNYNNEYVVLSWTAYEKWESGVKEYLIESSVDGQNWSVFQSAIQLAFTDKKLPYNNEAFYYRIKAVEQNGYEQESYSNVVKVALKSTLFIPNAFTPNGDGVNDIFSVGTWGITNFDCHIYSRWGQQVAHSTDPSNIWDGTFNEEPFAMDNYRYVIDATTTEGIQLHFDGTLVLIR